VQGTNRESEIQKQGNVIHESTESTCGGGRPLISADDAGGFIKGEL